MWYKIKKIYQWTNQVRPSGWAPDASRTLLYLPLESDATDMSWNSRTTSANSVTYTTVGWVKSAHVWSGWWISVWGSFLSQSISKRTISCLVYWTSQYNSHRRAMCNTFWSTSNMGLLGKESTSYIQWWTWWVGISTESPSNAYPANQRFHIVWTWEDWANNNKLYINWEVVATANGTSIPRWYSGGSWYYVMRTDTNDESLDGNMREMIWENVVWSAEDVSNYYNRIKAKLWF